MTRLALLLGAGLVALSGCTTPPPPTAAQIRAQIARLPADAIDRPLLLADLPSVPTAATLRIVGRNGDVATWQAADGTQLSFRQGVLVATRGLGHDLMSADVSGTRAALAGDNTGGHARFASYLDGQNRSVFVSFLCRITDRDTAVADVGRGVPATRVAESCTSPELSVTHEYWIAADGTMIRSRQWVSPEIGHVATERLDR